MNFVKLIIAGISVICGIAAGAETPLGREVVYSRSSVAVAPQGDIPFETEDYGFAGIIVYSDNGKVYLKNPFSQYPTGTYLEGIVDGGKITVELPQKIATVYDEEADESVDLYVYVLASNAAGTAMVPTEKQSYVLVDDAGSWVAEDAEALLGMTYDNAIWTGFAELSLRYDPIDVNVAEVPEGIAFEPWVVIYGEEGHSVQLAVDGTDCYIKNLLKTEEGDLAPIKGSVTENGMVFPSGQYLGVNEDNGYLTYFYGATRRMEYSEEAGTYLPVYEKADNLTFSTVADGVYQADRCALFTPLQNLDSEYMWDMGCYETPLLRKNDVTDFVPADPSISAYSYYPSLYFGYVTFDIPMLSVDGMLLDDTKLYYNVFINGDKFTLYPDEYHMLTEEITDIPYNFTDATPGKQGDIFVDGSLHTLILFTDGMDSVGVQSFYKTDDGTEYRSQLVTYEIAGIEGVSGSPEVIEETFTDLSGRMLKTPASGMYIRTLRYSDGTVRSFKEICR